MVLCHIERGKSVHVSQEKVVQANKSNFFIRIYKYSITEYLKHKRIHEVP